jgi:hypothetical protein
MILEKVRNPDGNIVEIIKKNNGKQKTDNKHPVRAAPMLIDIFCNYVKV